MEPDKTIFDWRIQQIANEETIKRLARQGINLQGLGDRFVQHCLKALLGDRLDEVMLSYERELAEKLVEWEREGRKQQLINNGYTPGDTRA